MLKACICLRSSPDFLSQNSESPGEGQGGAAWREGNRDPSGGRVGGRRNCWGQNGEFLGLPQLQGLCPTFSPQTRTFRSIFTLEEKGLRGWSWGGVGEHLLSTYQVLGSIRGTR